MYLAEMSSTVARFNAIVGTDFVAASHIRQADCTASSFGRSAESATDCPGAHRGCAFRQSSPGSRTM